MQSSPISIKVENLTRVFPSKGKEKKTIVANDNLSFEIRRGEIFGLLGPNGAGKTTLISLLLGLLQPTSGSIWMEGIDVVKNPDAVKNLVGLLPQTGLPMRYVEVERALLYTGQLRGQTQAAARRQANQLLEDFGMNEYRHRYVNRLSGGMLRLTNFAMSLMGEPQVLVLDEPTNELDPHKRRLVWDKISQLNRERGVTCILVTHNVLEAEKVIQRVAVMQKGKIVALGTPGELKLSSGGKVRLEFWLKDGEVLTTTETQRIKALGADLEQVRPGHFRFYLQPQQVSAATDIIVNDLGMHKLDDFRLAPPSLEDVYLELDQMDEKLELQENSTSWYV